MTTPPDPIEPMANGSPDEMEINDTVAGVSHHAAEAKPNDSVANESTYKGQGKGKGDDAVS
jgi:hypothetical protein